MEFNFSGRSFRPWWWNRDTWTSIQVRYPKQSPWENPISPTWRIHFCSNLWGWKDDISSYLKEKFQNVRSRNFGDTAESISGISADKIGKLGLPVLGDSLHCFHKRSTLDISHLRGPYFYPIISFKFQVLKIRVSLTNSRSTSSRTRADTSNW